MSSAAVTASQWDILKDRLFGWTFRQIAQYRRCNERTVRRTYRAGYAQLSPQQRTRYDAMTNDPNRQRVKPISLSICQNV